MADFRNSEKVKNGRLMSFLLSRGLMAFACVCTTLEWWRKCSRISLWLFFFLSRATNSTLNQTTAILSHLKKKMSYYWNTLAMSMYFCTTCNCTMCNLLLLGKLHTKCWPINAFHLFFNFFMERQFLF